MRFFVIYIKEAHPIDGWRTRGNDRAGIKVTQPKTELERVKVAKTACTTLKLGMPCLLDDMKNSTDAKYSGWPDRLYVIGHDGKIAYGGARGPRGFDPAAWEKHIKQAIEKAPKPKPDPKAGDDPADASKDDVAKKKQ